jgi:hypothetical protein
MQVGRGGGVEARIELRGDDDCPLIAERLD